MPYCPFRHFPLGASPKGFVRLACLIHAANVRSEPGSNPSKVVACQPGPKSGRMSDPKGLKVAKGRNSKLGDFRLGLTASASVTRGCASPFGDTHPRIGSYRAPICQRSRRHNLRIEPVSFQAISVRSLGRGGVMPRRRATVKIELLDQT